MDRLKVAAQFVAFVYFLNRKSAQPATPESAGRFARQNWPAFLLYVDDGMAKLLTAMQRRPGKARRLADARSAQPSRQGSRTQPTRAPAAPPKCHRAAPFPA